MMSVRKILCGLLFLTAICILAVAGTTTHRANATPIPIEIRNSCVKCNCLEISGFGFSDGNGGNTGNFIGCVAQMGTVWNPVSTASPGREDPLAKYSSCLDNGSKPGTPDYYLQKYEYGTFSSCTGATAGARVAASGFGSPVGEPYGDAENANLSFTRDVCNPTVTQGTE